MSSAEPQLPINPYKEYKYFSSYSINLEIQCEICRLELPRSERIGTSVVQEELYCTSTLYSNQMSFHEVPISSHYSSIDSYRNNLNWNEVMTYPVKIRDLSWNSTLVFTVWTSKRTLFGSTTMKLFDNKGRLKRGKQKLLIYRNSVADYRLQSCTDGEAYGRTEHLRTSDLCFQLEKKLEAFQEKTNFNSNFNNEGKSTVGSESVRLNEFTHGTLQTALETLRHTYSPYSSAASDTDTDGGSEYYSSTPTERELLEKCFLVVKLPLFPHPVLFEEKLYPT
eukprot:gene6452-13035_t